MVLKIIDYALIEAILKDPHYNIPDSIESIQSEKNMWYRWYSEQDFEKDAKKIETFRERIRILDDALDNLRLAIGDYKEKIRQGYR